jgi:hypothetical protein
MRQRASAVGRLAPPREVDVELFEQPVARGVAEKRADRRRVAVPGRRRDRAPAQLRGRLDRRRRRLGAGRFERAGQCGERLGVRAARLLAEAGLRDERCGVSEPLIERPTFSTQAVGVTAGLVDGSV